MDDGVLANLVLRLPNSTNSFLPFGFYKIDPEGRAGREAVNLFSDFDRSRSEQLASDFGEAPALEDARGRILYFGEVLVRNPAGVFQTDRQTLRRKDLTTKRIETLFDSKDKKLFGSLPTPPLNYIGAHASFQTGTSFLLYPLVGFRKLAGEGISVHWITTVALPDKDSDSISRVLTADRFTAFTGSGKMAVTWDESSIQTWTPKEGLQLLRQAADALPNTPPPGLVLRGLTTDGAFDTYLLFGSGNEIWTSRL